MSKNIIVSWFKKIALGFIGLFIVISFHFYNPLAINAQEVLKVGTEPAFPPFEMQAPDSNELTGFDIDLFRAIGEEVGLEIQFQSMPFDGLIPALQSKTIDAAISGMTITAERAQTVDFSRPYFQSGLAIAINKENKGEISSFEDLENKRIAVAIGTTGAKQAETIAGAKISTFDNSAIALQELSNGNADAVVNDAPVTLYAIKISNLNNVEVVGELLTEEYYGIALPKNSPNLEKVNDGLDRLLQSGRYRELYQKWFAGEPAELPLVAPELQGEGNAFDWGITFRNLLWGALITVMLTAFSVFFGSIGGALLATASISDFKPLGWLSRIYIDFFRGTPLLVQIFMIYFGLPSLLQQIGLDFTFNRFAAAVTALSFNSAAYLAEIIRGGIQSIDRGQWEASQSMGMSWLQTMRYVIFPQALRRMLPPLGNEFITMIKDTSLVAIIGFEELFRQGQLMVATTYRAFEIYAAVALIYLLLTFVASRVFSWLEKRLNPVRRASTQEATTVTQKEEQLVSH
ncbi:Polar amino acid ABC transporter inner membrane subunit [Hyella patelloides LEGE 07179]|uniref:Polar amino acid ABC transporter inner membrane subunit n=1 Tax=Hyella patelloides LEGE 07179 TaxID=945734 RepID=A0A563VS47_9CYAN|nr:ABC transporter permease subunit [Hyella patelloides]VEP14233.1 Polar amino acid ABC transporter inner membrane subunit [Hyella patelloides LEGE 07179]